MELLHSVNCRRVVDYSAGDGPIGIASMALGLNYFGLVFSPGHQTFLNLRLDGAAIGYCLRSRDSSIWKAILDVPILFADIMPTQDSWAQQTSRFHVQEAMRLL